MSIREFYESIGSDYQRVLGTLMNDNIAKKFALRFLDDGSFTKMKDAVCGSDIKEAFAAVHTFKGVTGNLGFYKLYDATCLLCEQLRPQTEPADMNLFSKVEEEYLKVMAALQSFKENQ